MKKFIAVLLAVTTLLCGFGLAAPVFAGEGDVTPAPEPIVVDICVGQIYPVRKLVEDMGLEYVDDTLSSTVSRIERSGGVELFTDWGEHVKNIYYVYGTAVGQGTVTLTFRDRAQPQAVFTFNVTAAVDPVVKEVCVQSNAASLLSNLKGEGSAVIPVVQTLAELGYTLDDVAYAAYWNPKGYYYDGSMHEATDGKFPDLKISYDSVGMAQVLMNMKDGKMILINVNITADQNKSFWETFAFPFAAPFVLPLVYLPRVWAVVLAYLVCIPLSPLIVLYSGSMLFLFGAFNPIEICDRMPVLSFE